MSSIEEKLKLFNELILRDAVSERDRILAQIRTQAEETLRQKRAEFQEQADELLNKEIMACEREKNNIVSRALMEAKQLLMKTREDILAAVTADVRDRLARFAEGEEYIPYLVEQIRKSCAQAGGSGLVVYVSSRDMEKLGAQMDALRRELPADTVFEEMGDDGIGGCRVLNKKDGILVDNTFSKRLELGTDEFFEVCRLRIE